MFSKTSRYQKLPDDVTADVRGRRLRSKSLRLAPPADARFAHLLEEGERLDHLAYKYYQQPRDWWRICDANPELLSPWELIGAEPWTTVEIEVTHSGSRPPWAPLLAALRRSPGVTGARYGNAEWPFPHVEKASGADETTTEADEATRHWLLVLDFNRLTTTLDELATVIESKGFTATAPRQVGRVGRPLSIPPRID